ncbi:Hsp20/alpha crystallin family protein [Acidobacteriota bacterium]
MAIVRWRPFDEMFTLRREMDRVFDRVFGDELPGTGEGWGSWHLPINVSETPNEFIVTAEVPGMAPNDIDISLHDNVLTVKCEKKREKEEKDENFHRVERTYGTFSRKIMLTTAVANDKVSADYKSGLLRITLPKSETAKKKTIKISV